jgi:hypothetical protein
LNRTILKLIHHHWQVWVSSAIKLTVIQHDNFVLGDTELMNKSNGDIVLADTQVKSSTGKIVVIAVGIYTQVGRPFCSWQFWMISLIKKKQQHRITLLFWSFLYFNFSLKCEVYYSMNRLWLMILCV